MDPEPPFGLEFANIPHINLRSDFNGAYELVFSPEFEQALGPVHQVIDIGLCEWRGTPDELSTFLLQSAILGVEAYLPGALWHSSVFLGKVSNELFAKLDNPFSFGARSAVENIYHRMPSELAPSFSLKVHDRALYEQTKLFYKNVRNPLFHGQQLHKTAVQPVRYAFDYLARIYEWIDHWYDPENLIKGGGRFAGVRQRHGNAKPAV